MACDIELSLDPDGPIEVGGELIVRVKAISTEAATCHLVHCEAVWQTHGRGERDGDQAFVKRVPGAAMIPGVPLEREFRLAVPPTGPVTYSGFRLSRRSLLSIDWKVRVCLEGQWLKDPDRERPFVVVPRGVPADPA